jgi:cell division protein FtsB
MSGGQKNGHVSVTSGTLITRILVGMLLTLVLASAIAIYFEQERQMARIHHQKEELAGELDEAAADLTELRELQHLVGSDAYIERVARDQLGMVKPDEIVFQNK